MLLVADTWDLNHFAADEAWQGSDLRRQGLATVARTIRK